MNCGDVYIGKCLSSYEPQLWFYYVLLSRDKDLWTVACFMKGQYGAQVKKYTTQEIGQLGYVGHILSLLPIKEKRSRQVVTKSSSVSHMAEIAQLVMSHFATTLLSMVEEEELDMDGVKATLRLWVTQS